MVKCLVALTLGAALSACAGQPAAPSAAAAPTAKAAQPGEAKAQTRRVCKTVPDDATGTKITTRRECHDVVDGKADQPKAD